jgi:hypothetical protein
MLKRRCGRPAWMKPDVRSRQMSPSSIAARESAPSRKIVSLPTPLAE